MWLINHLEDQFLRECDNHPKPWIQMHRNHNLQGGEDISRVHCSCLDILNLASMVVRKRDHWMPSKYSYYIFRYFHKKVSMPPASSFINPHSTIMRWWLGRNNLYIGTLEAWLQSSNKEPMYGLVRPPLVWLSRLIHVDFFSLFNLSSLYWPTLIPTFKKNHRLFGFEIWESSWCRVGFIAYLAVGGLLASYLPTYFFPVK